MLRKTVEPENGGSFDIKLWDRYQQESEVTEWKDLKSIRKVILCPR